MKTIHFFLLGIIIFTSSLNGMDQFIEKLKKKDQKDWKKRIARIQVSTEDHETILKEMANAKCSIDQSSIPALQKIEAEDLKEVEEKNPRAGDVALYYELKAANKQK